MAIVSKFSHTSATVDLNDTTGGFSLAGDGWLPVVAAPVYQGEPDPVVETLHLLLTDTSQDNIAADIQALHEMQRLADEYTNDPRVIDPVWLHAKMDSETGERRAVVYKIEVQYGASWYGDEATSLDIPVTINVTRGPYWERTTPRELPDVSNASGLVYTYDYTAAGASVAAHDIVGDVGARVAFFEFSPDSPFSPYKFWMGLRSADKHGTLATFQPVWELESATAHYTDVTTGSDTGASGGGKITVSESALEWDNTWQKVALTRGQDHSANNEENYGTFLHLVRAKTSSSSVWEIRLLYGVSETTSHFQYGNISEVSATAGPDWRIVEMDVKHWPIMNAGRDFIDELSTTNFSNKIILQARRTAGAADLDIDCLIKIPIDEGFCFIELENTTGSTNAIDLSQAEDNKISYYVTNYDVKYINLENFTLPVGDGRLYYVATSATATNLTETTDFNVTVPGQYYERWSSLRGSE